MIGSVCLICGCRNFLLAVETCNWLRTHAGCRTEPFSRACRVVQHVLIIPDDLQRDVQLARDTVRVTLAQRFGARVLDRVDEAQRGLPACPAFGLDAIRGSTAIVVVPGVDELVAERAPSLEVRHRLIQYDQPGGFVVEAAQSAWQTPLLDADPQQQRLRKKSLQSHLPYRRFTLHLFPFLGDTPADALFIIFFMHFNPHCGFVVVTLDNGGSYKPIAIAIINRRQ